MMSADAPREDFRNSLDPRCRLQISIATLFLDAANVSENKGFRRSGTILAFPDGDLVGERSC